MQQRRVHRSERQAKLKGQILWNECAVCNVVVVLFKPPIPSFILSLFLSFICWLFIYDKKTKSVYFVITDDVMETSSSCYVYRCTDNVVIETKYCREKTFAPSPQFFFLKNKKKPRWLRKVFDMIHESCTKLNDTRKRSNKLVWSYANYSCVATLYRPQRSCEGYVFTGVCLSTGGCLVPGGGVGIPACTEAEPPPPGRDRGAWFQGGLVSQHAPRQTPPGRDGYCCGRYASYWNAFLLFFLYLSESNIASKWGHRKSNLMFTFRSDKDQRKNSVSLSFSKS